MKKTIKEVELEEIQRLKNLARSTEIDMDVEWEVERWAGGFEPDWTFDIYSTEGAEIHEAFQEAAILKEELDQKIQEIESLIEEFNQAHTEAIYKKIEEIQNYGIEIACPELVEGLEDE